MSPRGFKLGLALFVLMSGLFGAKLSLLGPEGLRARWSMTATLGLGQRPETGPETAGKPSADAAPPQATAAAPLATAAPPQAAVASPDAAASAEAKAAKETETAAHLSPPVAELDGALVAAIKRELQARGYASGGAAPGMMLEARAAVMAFEADNDMRLTGEASQPLLHRLLFGTSPGGQANLGTPPTALAEDVIRTVQRALQNAGYPDVKPDGKLDSETAETIRAFERANAMKVTGRVSGELVARLQRVARDKTSHAGH